jgi:hypothetical protein
MLKMWVGCLFTFVFICELILPECIVAYAKLSLYLF